MTQRRFFIVSLHHIAAQRQSIYFSDLIRVRDYGFYLPQQLCDAANILNKKYSEKTMVALVPNLKFVRDRRLQKRHLNYGTVCRAARTINRAPPAEVIEHLKNHKPENASPPRRLFIKTGIKPVDLYCYFHARFGPPNGLQSFLRQNDSSNIFHWHYSLWTDERAIEIMAGTYKIEVWFPEQFCYSEQPLEDFVAAIVDDLRNHGPALKAIRGTLEKWLSFANPFYRLHLALEGMLKRAGDLLETTKRAPKHPETKEESDVSAKEFQPIANASYEAFGLCRSVRMPIPVLAETFVNFLIFILCKPEIKGDERLHESVKRAQIDIRIKSLHLHCVGFSKAVDYSTEACKNIHSIFNNRNDLLHGNVNPQQEQHEIVYFNGTVPLFVEWRDFHQRCFASQLQSADYDLATKEMDQVQAFIEEVVKCLDASVAAEIRKMLDFSELGYNPDTKRIGLLFPNLLFDYITEFSEKGPSTSPEP
jgi:hypothetical protein